MILICLGKYTQAVDNVCVEKGMLDLRGQDLTALKDIKLNGEWEFYWNRLLSSDDFKNVAFETIRYIKVPSVWLNYEINGQKLPRLGAATYRMRVLLDTNHQKMAIKIGSVGTAFNLFVDGQILKQAGKVSLNKDEGLAAYNPGVVTFYPKSDTLEVIFQISNYHYAHGGIWDNFGRIGSEVHVLKSWDRDIQLSVLFIGSILIFAIYHFGLYVLNRNFRYTLYFSLFCIIIVFRTLVVNEIFLLNIFPTFNWVTLIRIEYFTLILGTVAFTLFIYKFFIEEYSHIFLKIILIISGFFTLITLVTPTVFFTKFLLYFQLNILLAAVYIIYVVVKALIRKKQSALILLIGFLILLITVVNDILYANRVIDTMLLTSFGFIIFIFSQSYMLSERFASLLVQTESLAQSLGATNQNLEKLVEERTTKIQDQNLVLREQSNVILLNKEELEQQNDEIKAQRDILQKQNELVNSQKKFITNSIEYASKIQNVVLDSANAMYKVAPDSFVLFHPKDIVSGDFYWFKELEFKNRKLKFAAVVDCTGHGVPGALMSIMGAMFLNKIVGELTQTPKASDILNRMRLEVKSLLRQHSSEILVKDGMDMGIAIMDYYSMKLQYAGAHNPLYIIPCPNGKQVVEIEEFKGDNMPIGIYVKEKESFTNYTIDVNKGDLVYLFSDGYYDQFGGESGKKLKKNTFKKILLANAHLTMSQQKNALDIELTKWQGNFDQIDDITVVGIRI
jgi:serine phosphatase RsbU (regulator of sigma subunit)